MLESFILNVSFRVVKMTDTMFPVRVLRAIEGTTGQMRSQFGAGNAENLLVHDVIDAFLPVWNLRFKTPVQALYDFTQENAAFRERVKERCFRTSEQFLRKQIQDLVGQGRRSEDLVIAQIGNTVEDVGIVIIRHRILG